MGESSSFAQDTILIEQERATGDSLDVCASRLSDVFVCIRLQGDRGASVT